MESRETKGSVNIWKLGSDVYRGSSAESDTDESSGYSLRSNGILSMHSYSATLSFVCFLRLATLAFVSFAILPDQLLDKPSYGKII